MTFTFQHLVCSVLSKFVGLVGQSDIFLKCPTKNVSLPDQMSDKNFPTKKNISSSVTRNPQKMAAAFAKQKQVFLLKRKWSRNCIRIIYMYSIHVYRHDMYVNILKQLIWKAILNCTENVTIFRNILLSNLRPPPPPCYKINECSLFFRFQLYLPLWNTDKHHLIIDGMCQYKTICLNVVHMNKLSFFKLRLQTL